MERVVEPAHILGAGRRRNLTKRATGQPNNSAPLHGCHAEPTGVTTDAAGAAAIPAAARGSAGRNFQEGVPPPCGPQPPRAGCGRGHVPFFPHGGLACRKPAPPRWHWWGGNGEHAVLSIKPGVGEDRVLHYLSCHMHGRR